MHTLRRDRIKRQRSVWEYALLSLTAITVFALAVAAHDRGIAQKWVTAVFGTAFPFAFVTYLRRESLRRSFWLSLAICLAVHCITIALVFRYVLIDFQTFSPLLWYPVMIVEVFVLLIAVKRIEDKLTGTHEVVRLKF